MKLTDLLKKDWKTLNEELLDDLFSHIKDKTDKNTFPESLISKEEIHQLIDVLENNFGSIDYTNNYELLEWVSEHPDLVDDTEEVEDIQKEILYRTFVFLINNKYYKLEFQTGYYDFPLSNDMPQVYKRTRKVEYFSENKK